MATVQMAIVLLEHRKLLKLVASDHKLKRSRHPLTVVFVVYHTNYMYTDDVQNWIGCDGCELRFHFKCVGVITVPEVFIAHSVSLKVNFGRV